MIEADLPKECWAEAMVSATFLTDIVPTKAEIFSELFENSLVKPLTPFEAWHGAPYPVPKLLRTIGSDAYVHKEGPELEKQGKIGPRSDKMVLIGYRDSSTYRLYDRKTKLVTVSCSVDINEKPMLTGFKPAEIEEVDEDSEDPTSLINENSNPESLENSEDPTSGTLQDEILQDPEPVAPAAARIPKKDRMPNPPSRTTVPKTKRGRPRKNLVDKAVMMAKVLEWKEPDRKIEPLTVKSLFEQDIQLLEDPDIWFRPAKDLKVYSIVQQQRLGVNGIIVPTTYKEAVNSPQALQWIAAMDAEIDELEKRKVYTLVEKPNQKGLRTLRGKWVFLVKTDEDGGTARFKARWVVQGFRQQKGIDYNQTYAPVVAGSTIRTIFAVAAVRGWHVKQIDFITAFLNGALNETVYMIQPIGYEKGQGLVCKLNQGLYGLKQSSRIWYEMLTKHLKELGFEKSQYDGGLWFHKEKGIYLTVYVDDVKLIGPDEDELDKMSKQIACRFRIKNLGHAHHYLGMKVEQNRKKKTIRLSQKVFIKELLKEYGMENCYAVSTPMRPGLKITDEPVNDSEFIERYQSAVGSCQFLASYTRLDIAFAAGFLARWNHAPTKQCWDAVIWLLRYLRGTLDLGIEFDGSEGFRIAAYSDSDWGADLIDRKSTSGSLIKIAGGPVLWRSSKQSGVSLSTTEAEYIAASETAKSILIIRGILMELDVIDEEFVFPLMIDNTGGIAISGGEKVTRNARHIDIRYHHIRDLVAKRIIEVLYIPSAQMAADGLTKALAAVPFQEFRQHLGLTSRSELNSDSELNGSKLEPEKDSEYELELELGDIAGESDRAE